MKTIATVAAAIVAAIAKTNRKFYRERQRVSEQIVQILFFYPKKEYNVAEREVQRLAKILGNSIVERRKILGMTQIELANHLTWLQTLCHVSKMGMLPLDLTELKRWSKVLECSVAELFSRKKRFAESTS